MKKIRKRIKGITNEVKRNESYEKDAELKLAMELLRMLNEEPAGERNRHKQDKKEPKADEIGQANKRETWDEYWDNYWKASVNSTEY